MTTDPGLGGRSELWSLREDVRISPGDGPLRLRSQWGEVTIERPSPVVREALRRMRLGPVSLENVTGPGPGDNDRARLDAVLDRIQPLVIRTLGSATGQPLLSVVPLAPQARFDPVPLAPDARVALSTFAQLRTDGREYRLESPLSLHRVQLHRPEALWLIGRLARAGEQLRSGELSRARSPRPARPGNRWPMSPVTCWPTWPRPACWPGPDPDPSPSPRPRPRPRAGPRPT